MKAQERLECDDTRQKEVWTRKLVAAAQAEIDQVNGVIRRVPPPPIYLHVQYNLRGVSRKAIRRAFAETCLKSGEENIAGVSMLSANEF